MAYTRHRRQVTNSRFPDPELHLASLRHKGRARKQYLAIMLYFILAVVLLPYFAFSAIQASIFGNGSAVRPDGKYEICAEGIRAYFIPYGASLSNLFIQDIHGKKMDIVLGFDNATEYSESALHPHLNGVPGRYANRIKNGSFEIDGTTYHTDLNEHGLDTLHGGSNGWDYRNWTVVAHTTDSITFSLTDPPDKMGFPGEVVAYVTYSMMPYQWHLRMTALSTTKRTPIMLSSHTYLNLDGFENPGANLALDYSLYMPHADRRIETDNILIPTGDVVDIEEGGVFDFWSRPKTLGRDLGKPAALGGCGFNCTGYDTCFPFNRESNEDWEKEPVATLKSDWSGIQLDLYTDQAAMQVFTCTNMNGTFALKETQGFFNDSSHPRVVEKYGCVVLEVEDWIDGINNPEWGRDPYQIFGPDDDTYVLEATYRFSLNR